MAASSSTGTAVPSAVGTGQEAVVVEEDQEEVTPAAAAGADCFLVFCALLSVATAGSALACAVVNAVSVWRSVSSREDVFAGILRCYGVVAAIFVAVAETEWQWVFKFWHMLEAWTARGMLQIFVAVLTRAMAHRGSESAVESTLQDIASWVLLSCGFVYTFAGLLCFGALKRRRIQRQSQRAQAVKDLEDLERRKRELQGLLAHRV